MATKADIINDAYSQLRISGLTVVPNANEVELALDRLEDMMHEFRGRNICLGYNFEECPDPNSDIYVHRKYFQLLKTNLALRLVPDYGVAPTAILTTQARQSLSAASASVAGENMREVHYPITMPRGSGNTQRFNSHRRYQRPVQRPPQECETKYMIEGEICDFQESFVDWLKGDEIQEWEVESDPALDLHDAVEESGVFTYRIEALELGAEASWQQVRFKVTSNDGRHTIRILNFEITPASTIGGH